MSAHIVQLKPPIPHIQAKSKNAKSYPHYMATKMGFVVSMEGHAQIVLDQVVNSKAKGSSENNLLETRSLS